MEIGKVIAHSDGRRELHGANINGWLNNVGKCSICFWLSRPMANYKRMEGECWIPAQIYWLSLLEGASLKRMTDVVVLSICWHMGQTGGKQINPYH